MSAPADTEETALPGLHPVHRVAQSYLGSLWIALLEREGEPGQTVLVRRLQLPSDTPAEARLHVARAGRDALDLRHPNLLSAIDVLEAGQELAVAYAHVEAEPLRSLQSWANLRGLTFPVGVSLAIMSDLLRGLTALHAVAGTASVSPFGGLSPDSVLVTRAGDAQLSDSLVASCASLLPSIGSNTAKLGYAAPEQVHVVAPLTRASDLFACGAMLWELLAARRLLSGSRAAIERRLLEHSLPNLADSLRGDQQVGSALCDLVGRALSHDPAKRPSGPAEMLKELQQCGHELASRQQVAQFVGKLSGQRLDRRNAAVRSKSAPQSAGPLAWPIEMAPSAKSSQRHGPGSAAAAPTSDAQTERSSEPPASSADGSPASSPLPTPPAGALAKPPHQRPAPAGLPPIAPRAGSALSPAANVPVHAPAEPKPITARMGAPAVATPPRRTSPSFVEPPPIPENFPVDEDDENDATVREQTPEDWSPPHASPARSAAANPVSPSAAPAVPIVAAAAGRRTVAGVGKPALHPALAASLPFANMTPGPFAAQPAPAQPAAAQPVAAQPVAAQPVAAQPVAAQPVAAGRGNAQPPAALPTAAPPTAAGPTAAPAPSVALAPASSSLLPSSHTLHSHRVAPPSSSTPAHAAPSLRPAMPSLRVYEPTFSMTPEELVPRVAPSARVTRRRSGWASALGLRPGSARRALLAGAAACVVLASAIVLVAWLRRPVLGPALQLDAAAAVQAAPARELTPPADASEKAAELGNTEPEPSPGEAEPLAPDAAAPASAAPDATEASDVPPLELAGNLASPQLDDRQLLQLFALERYEPWPSCPERTTPHKAARASGKKSGAKEAVRLLKAARGELMRGNNGKAQTLLCRATAQDASNSQAQQALAELALRFGNAAEAQTAIEKALARKPDDPTLLGILGDALAMSGDLPGSRRVWLRAIPSPGSDEERLRLVAGIYRKLGDRLLGTSSYAAACALFRRALVLSEGSYAPSIGLAQALRRLQQAPAALAWAERAAHAFPQDSRVQLLFGDVLYDNGQTREARAAWRAARKAQPSNPLAAQRLARGKP